MKKFSKYLLVLVSLIALGVGLAACGGDPVDMEEVKQELIDHYKDTIGKSTYVVTDDVELISTIESIKGLTITWVSADTNFVANDGSIVRFPTVAEGNKKIAVEATLKVGKEEIKYTFYFSLNPETQPGTEPDKTSFELVGERVVLDSEKDLNGLVTFNDYGSDGPELSLSKDIKQFGEASIKVFNKAEKGFNSNNSWPSVELAFKKAQDFSTKKYTAFHIYNAEEEPFVMDIQYSVDGESGFKSNLRQINPGWNVVEITNGQSRDFTIPQNFAKITSFIFSIYGHATVDCTYYIDDILLTNDTSVGGNDVFELVSFKNTKYAETKGANKAVPYTLFEDCIPSVPTTAKLGEDGELILTQYHDWHFYMFGAFNNNILAYDYVMLEFENVDDKDVSIGLSAEGGDYRDNGPRIAPSAVMQRATLKPGESTILMIKVQDIVNALKAKDSSLSINNLICFHVFSVGETGVNRTFAISNFKLVTSAGLDMEFAAKVDKGIAKLPSVDKLGANDIKAVESIRKDYNALTDSQKALVENLALLEALEARIKELGAIEYAKGMEEKIDALPHLEEITLENKEAIVALKNEYDALTQEIKEKVTNVAKLEEALLKIAELHGDVVEALIAALPDVEDAKSSDKLAVSNARKAYDSLTDSGKTFVLNYAKLEALEEVLASIIGSSEVETMINELKQEGSFSAEDINAILAVREAYEALDSEEQAKVTNLDKLVLAEELMVKVFDFNADNISGLKAGLYGGNSPDQVEYGYEAGEVGGISGVAWFSSKTKDGEFIPGDDTNGDGYANDNSYIGTNFAHISHSKEAYEALLAAGYTKITFKYYQVTEAGSIQFWSRFGDGAFFWFGAQGTNSWITVELSLEQFLGFYDQTTADLFSIIGGDVNTATTLTTVYFTDVTVAKEKAPEPTPELTAGEEVAAQINELKQEGSFSAEDINAILAVREAYEALDSEEQAKVTNLDKLVLAEELMVKVFDFNADNISGLKAGLYGPNSPDQVEHGYEAGEVGGISGVAWFSSKTKDGEFIPGDDTNGDGYANDNSSIGTNFAHISHSKEAYEALLAAGYTKITFKYYQVTEAGSIQFWSRFGDGAFFWLGAQDTNSWITVELSLEQFLGFYDQTTADLFSIIGGDVNTATTLTTVYFTDLIIQK